MLDAGRNSGGRVDLGQNYVSFSRLHLEQGGVGGPGLVFVSGLGSSTLEWMDVRWMGTVR